MKEIPELEEIIRDSENSRFNKAWDKRDRLFRRSMGYMLMGVFCIVPLGLFIGHIGIITGCILFIVSSLPVILLNLVEIFSFCFKDPTPRDPTKRYLYK